MHNSLSQTGMRTVTRDLKIHDIVVKKGHMAAIMVDPMMHDESAFVNASTFNETRFESEFESKLPRG